MASVGQLQGVWGRYFSLNVSQSSHPSLPHPATPFTLPASTVGSPGTALLKLERSGTISAVWILPGAWHVLGQEGRSARALGCSRTWRPGGELES